ncbi:MAG: helix-turn-helix domain-containing protein, partial [Clostridia bacterium]|nr:helix-turn-helix domain-containing protein [Clostridia bacterium]
MTQEQLAEKLFVSRETVSKWELGQRRPDIRTLRDIAELFCVDIGELADRGGIVSELDECVPPGLKAPPPGEGVAPLVGTEELSRLLAAFLESLSERDRGIFVRR